MTCGRCGRTMAYEQFFGSQEHFWGWRCIFCGEIIDDVIIENRQWLKERNCVWQQKGSERPSYEGKETHLYWSSSRDWITSKIENGNFECWERQKWILLR